MAIIDKDVAMLYQHLQYIMLQIHQYMVHNIYKPGPDLYTADWTSWNNHTENKDWKSITGINANMSSPHQWIYQYADP